jgi:hypothetical protein
MSNLPKSLLLYPRLEAIIHAVDLVLAHAGEAQMVTNAFNAIAHLRSKLHHGVPEVPPEPAEQGDSLCQNQKMWIPTMVMGNSDLIAMDVYDR